jgi:hypothetical protein
VIRHVAATIAAFLVLAVAWALALRMYQKHDQPGPAAPAGTARNSVATSPYAVATNVDDFLRLYERQQRAEEHSRRAARRAAQERLLLTPVVAGQTNHDRLDTMVSDNEPREFAAIETRPMSTPVSTTRPAPSNRPPTLTPAPRDVQQNAEIVPSPEPDRRSATLTPMVSETRVWPLTRATREIDALTTVSGAALIVLPLPYRVYESDDKRALANSVLSTVARAMTRSHVTATIVVDATANGGIESAVTLATDFRGALVSQGVIPEQIRLQVLTSRMPIIEQGSSRERVVVKLEPYDTFDRSVRLPSLVNAVREATSKDFN